MWIRKPKYPVKSNLPKIDHHDNLPSGAILLGELYDNFNKNTWMFVNNNNTLSILKYYERKLKDGQYIYRCYQREFPLEFLQWFSKALTEFRKSPIEGGLPAGAMTSADEEVGGEMLCIQRAMGAGGGRGGYAVLNRSRCERGYNESTEFEPHEISWDDSFLFEDGLLDLIKDLGERFEQGKL